MKELELGGNVVTGRTKQELRKMLVPLALAQFICSFAGSNMKRLHTDNLAFIEA